jgi:hypothetical protein
VRSVPWRRSRHALGHAPQGASDGTYLAIGTYRDELADARWIG